MLVFQQEVKEKHATMMQRMKDRHLETNNRYSDLLEQERQLKEELVHLDQLMTP